jgi:hypothetical protein
MTIHPDVSGHPHVLMMIERVISYIKGQPGVIWSTLDEIASAFSQRCPRLT